jgi:hypothetical protein
MNLKLNTSLFALILLLLTECKDSNQVKPPNTTNTNSNGTIEYVSEANKLLLTNYTFDMVEDAKGDVWLVDGGVIYRFSGTKVAQKFSVNNGNINSQNLCQMFVKNKSGDVYVHSSTVDVPYNELYKISNSNLISVFKGNKVGFGPTHIFFNKLDELEIFSGSSSNPFYDKYNLSTNTFKTSTLGFSYQGAIFDGINYWYIDGRKLFKSGVSMNIAKDYTEVRSQQGRVFAFCTNIGLDIFQSNKWTFVNSNFSSNYPMDFRPFNFTVSANGEIFLYGTKGGVTDNRVCVIKIGQDLTVSEISLESSFLSKGYMIVRSFADSNGFLWMIYVNKSGGIDLARLKL